MLFGAFPLLVPPTVAGPLVTEPHVAPGPLAAPPVAGPLVADPPVAGPLVTEPHCCEYALKVDVFGTNKSMEIVTNDILMFWAIIDSYLVDTVPYHILD